MSKNELSPALRRCLEAVHDALGELLDTHPGHANANGHGNGHDSSKLVRHKWTPEEDARVIELRAAGVSFRKIGEEFGMTARKIRSHHDLLTNRRPKAEAKKRAREASTDSEEQANGSEAEEQANGIDSELEAPDDSDNESEPNAKKARVDEDDFASSDASESE